MWQELNYISVKSPEVHTDLQAYETTVVLLLGFTLPRLSGFAEVKEGNEGVK